MPDQLTRGAIVYYAEQSLIVWTHKPDGIALGIAIRPQTGPRHRSHVPISPTACLPLGLRPRASIVATAEPMIAIDMPPRFLGRAPAALLAEIADTIRRAHIANRFEVAMTGAIWA